MRTEEGAVVGEVGEGVDEEAVVEEEGVGAGGAGDRREAMMVLHMMGTSWPRQSRYLSCLT